MHYETLIYIALQASSALNTPPSVMIPDFKSLSEGWTRLMKHEGSSRQAVLTFPDSRLSLGQDDLEAWDQTTEFDPSHAFGWDVENPKREVEVPAFKMDVSPVTNGEYLAWLSKQGSTEGFFPASWSGEGTDEVKVKTLYGEIKLEYAQEWPVAASAVQLQAFAKVRRFLQRVATSAYLAISTVEKRSTSNALRASSILRTEPRRLSHGQHWSDQLASGSCDASFFTTRWNDGRSD